MGAPKLTPEQLERLAELREQGWPYSRIAQVLGVHPKTVAYRCLAEGIEAPEVFRCQPTPQEPLIYRRRGHVIRRFTQAEDAMLLELEAKGLRLSDIARLMDRPHNSVKGRLMTIARREEREAEASCFQKCEVTDDARA